MNDPTKKLLDSLTQIRPQPRPKSEKIYAVCAAALYPVWGLVSSALLFNADFLHGTLLRSTIGVVFAGLFPVALHLFEVQNGKAYFEWKTVFASISAGGIATLFLGSILQGVLLLCGIHSLFGLRLDTWVWKFPDWMLSDY